jgi:hypothetical protein
MNARPSRSVPRRARRQLSRIKGIAAALALAAFVACEEGNPLFGETGTVEVTVTGQGTPPNTYSASVQGAGSQNVALGNTAVFEDVPAGQRQVQLGNIPSGCEVLSNPRNVNVPVGGTARTTFIVSC